MYDGTMSLSSFQASLPLTTVEQYVYTSGQCHTFVAAAERVVGGTPRLLVATDPRQLAQHDWPKDERLELHVFLTMPNGMVLDAEGLRPQASLLKGFGVRTGWTYALENADGRQAFGQPDEGLVEALACRLKDLGWSEHDQPLATRALENRQAFQQAQDQARAWWPQWASCHELPEQAHALNAERWQEFHLPPDGKLALGENPFHFHAHLPDMHAIMLQKNPEARAALMALLGQPRHSDGKTPLHLLADLLAAEESRFSPTSPSTLRIGAHSLMQEIFKAQGEEVLGQRTNGKTMAQRLLEAFDEGTRKAGLPSAMSGTPLAALARQHTLEQRWDPEKLQRSRGPRL